MFRHLQFRPKLRLRTLFLFIAAAAAWLTAAANRQAIRALQARFPYVCMTGALRPSFMMFASELPERTSLERRWQIDLPPGEYVLKMAVRDIEAVNYPLNVRSVALPAGEHRLRVFMPVEDPDGWRMRVFLDDVEILKVVEPAEWRTAPNGGDELIRFYERDVPTWSELPLMRYRMGRRSGESDYTWRSDQEGPDHGILLWIQKCKLLPIGG